MFGSNEGSGRERDLVCYCVWLRGVQGVFACLVPEGDFHGEKTLIYFISLLSFLLYIIGYLSRFILNDLSSPPLGKTSILEGSQN